MRIGVVGAGFSGLIASCLCSAAGAEVTCISAGRGALSLSHGGIDILNHPHPSRRLNQLDSQHPYSVVGRESIKQSIKAIQHILDSQEYPLAGAFSKAYKLLTATGHTRWSSLVPLTFQAGDLQDTTRITIADLEGFRDFSAELICDSYRKTSGGEIKSITLPLPLYQGQKRWSSTDLTRSLSDPHWREELIQAWRARLRGVDRLGIPAVFSLELFKSEWQTFVESLGVSIFEIPTLPPSMPGIRLEQALRGYAREHRVEFIEGTRVSGIIDGTSRPPRAKGLMLHYDRFSRSLDLDAIILASGSFLNGGLIASRNGMVRESVFDLPVIHTNLQEGWVVPSLWEEQPYASFGVRVNKWMQPTSSKRKPIFGNLYAVGGLIAGADRTLEGSRQGIDIATAYQAVQHLLESS